MICDLHIHTKFSCDSDALMEEYCEKAIESNSQYICFTDHVDFNKNDYGYNYYNPDCFFNEFRKMQDKYGDKVTLLSGIEFSEPHLYKKELENLSKYPYDFIIGSVHWIGNMFPCRETREKYSAEKFYELYWKEVLNAVSYGNFDCLGHIDFPKRYYNEIVYNEDIIKDIFDKMNTNKIVLEINTSSLRKGLATTLPGIELLSAYQKCGGKLVTIGSDTHKVADLSADNIYAKELIEKAELNEIVFKQRKAILMK